MAIVNQKALNHYLKCGYNVLFEGKHGVGKTTIVKQVFEAAGLRWMYFSASTLDPWVDIIGVPRPLEREGKEPILSLLRPDYFADDRVDAVFFDELNRAPEKVLNAVMELIQFKSINGHKLHNLKVVWAAINPEDEEGTYSVSHLDPAQIDRFQVKIKIPFEVDTEYFYKKYPENGEAFVTWWKNLPKEIQETISPRRLDYAADAHANGCILKDFLPANSNISKLVETIKSAPFVDIIRNVSSLEEATELMKNINNVTKLTKMVKDKDKVAIEFFKRYGAELPQELTAGIAGVVVAAKSGAPLITSFIEVIEKLPLNAQGKGDQNTGEFLNNINWQAIYPKGSGGLRNDIIALNTPQTRNTLNVLKNAMRDIVMSVQAKTLERLFWGIGGIKGNKATSLNALITLFSAETLFSKLEASQMSTRLYQNKIVTQMNFVTGA